MFIPFRLGFVIVPALGIVCVAIGLYHILRTVPSSFALLLFGVGVLVLNRHEKRKYERSYGPIKWF